LAVNAAPGAPPKIVPAASVYHVNVPVAQLDVIFATEPEQIGACVNTGLAVIGFTNTTTGFMSVQPNAVVPLI
jgi:hypothetical protein